MLVVVEVEVDVVGVLQHSGLHFPGHCVLIDAVVSHSEGVTSRVKQTSAFPHTKFGPHLVDADQDGVVLVEVEVEVEVLVEVEVEVLVELQSQWL